MGIISLTWADIERLTGTVAEQVNARRECEEWDNFPDEDPDFVYGVPRGGLIPSVMLSHKLGLPISLLPNPYEPRSCIGLWVDDIYDTGATYQRFINSPLVDTLDLCKGWGFAVLVSKETKKNCPLDYVGLRVDSSDWVVFPWETTESTHLNNNQRLTYPESARV